MFPNRNSKWVLRRSRLSELVPSDVHSENDRFTTLVSDSNDQTVTLKVPFKPPKRPRVINDIPVDSFFFAVDGQHIPIDHQIDEIVNHIKEIQTNMGDKGMFSHIKSVYSPILP